MFGVHQLSILLYSPGSKTGAMVLPTLMLGLAILVDRYNVTCLQTNLI